jgi:uncharacterized protein (TIGR02186 family)
MRLLGVSAAICALGVGTAGAAAPAVPVTLMASESVIRITPRYRGELVELHGTAPAGCAVVVKLSAPGESRTCSCKGKVGPLWLSVDRIRFENVPRMYKVKSSGVLDDILDAAEQVRLGLGRRGLKASLGGQRGPNRELYVDELILIQQRERLYDFEDRAVEQDGSTFRTSFFWPPDGPPGRYHLEAYAVRNGRVVGSAETNVEVRSVGVEAWVRSLAHGHGILYGVLSVALAVVTGLAASVVFNVGSRPPRSAMRGR